MPRVLAPLIAAMFLLAPVSHAQQRCGDRDAVLAFHEARFGERLNARGVAGTSGVAELLLSEDGNWSLILTAPAPDSPSGMKSCLIATGDGWGPAEPRPASPPGRAS